MIEKADIIQQMPHLLSGSELKKRLSVLPEYDGEIIQASSTERLLALSTLYQIYLPSQMAEEIYSKLYLALMRSLQKKNTRMSVEQRNRNHKIVIGQQSEGILGGSDSFTIIGTSGIGKSSAINKVIQLITEGRIIEMQHPYMKIIPCLVVQTPFDASVKGLLIEILRKVDEVLGSNYYHNVLKTRATTDVLIGLVSQVALNNIGMLIVDEIQNVVNSKNGKLLVGSLTQLINNSGISICMVGTPECKVFFEQAQQLARRSLGLQYCAMKYDEEFRRFCKKMWEYQYVQNRTELTEGILNWLHEHSAGNVSVVVSLLHDSQEMAILSGKECLDLEVLGNAYQNRLSMLHGYIAEKRISKKQTSTESRKKLIYKEEQDSEVGNAKYNIAELVDAARKKQIDIVKLLKVEGMLEEIVI